MSSNTETRSIFSLWFFVENYGLKMTKTYIKNCRCSTSLTTLTLKVTGALRWKKLDAPGFDPGTFRMRSEHSTTELCPLTSTVNLVKGFKYHFFQWKKLKARVRWIFDYEWKIDFLFLNFCKFFRFVSQKKFWA